MMYNYMTKYLGVKLSTTPTQSFSDSNKVASYAVNAVNAMVNIGVINGYDDGNFWPKATATRAECAAMIMRLEEYLVG